MVPLTSARRNALPSSEFVFPKQRKYPLDTEARARNALSRGAQNASPPQQATIKRAVKRKYPRIDQGSGKLTMLGQRTLSGYQTKYGDDQGHQKFEDAIARGILDRSRMEVTGSPAQGGESNRRQVAGSRKPAGQGGPYVPGFNEEPATRGAMGTGRPEGVQRSHTRNPQESDTESDETKGGPPNSQDREPKRPARQRRGAQGSYQR